MPEKITLTNGVLNVPDEPIIPFIEGDGTGIDIWPAAQLVMDAAAAKHGKACGLLVPDGVAEASKILEGLPRFTTVGSDSALLATSASEQLTRPRNHRILETAFRPMTEASWG